MAGLSLTFTVVDYDRRTVLLLIWLAIAAGTMAAAELLFLAFRWLGS